MNQIINKVLGFLEEQVTAVLFAIVVVIVFIQVVFRAAGPSLPWSEEAARYINTWTVYFGASRCVRNSKHLSVDILPLLLKGTAKKVHAVFVDIVCFVFFAYVAWFGVQVLNELVIFPQKSAALRIDMVYCYAAPVVGMIMMAIRTVQKIVEHVKESPEDSGAQEEGGAA